MFSRWQDRAYVVEAFKVDCTHGFCLVLVNGLLSTVTEQADFMFVGSTPTIWSSLSRNARVKGKITKHNGACGATAAVGGISGQFKVAPGFAPGSGTERLWRSACRPWFLCFHRLPFTFDDALRPTLQLAVHTMCFVSIAVANA